ncbi:pseudouridine synthase [Coniochaeta sp. 2T2.1]|nr:pseudouridine synthase [Coniochaeta sp. 2T2.1]
MTSDANPAPPTTMVSNASSAPATAGEQASTGNGNGFRDNRKNNYSQRGNDKRGKSSRKRGGGFGSKKFDGPDKREQIHNNRMDRRRKVIEGEGDGNSFASVPFSAEEIAAEDRRPKRKVAVMIGYAGTGYHGIQINHKEKTIEGDLFSAFIAAGAISKANADDPKKSSLVRCARTDKGVHAAGNVLSLKLIIEDENLVDKINENLPDQIRVWGIQRTNNGFSCYQQCSSRWYEYLMPSYALLPPQPQSFLGKKVEESAKSKGVYDEYVERLGDVRSYWEEVEKNDIQPILEKLEPDVRAKVIDSIRGMSNQELNDEAAARTPETPATSGTKRSREPAADAAAENQESKRPKIANDAPTESAKEEAVPQSAPEVEAIDVEKPSEEAQSGSASAEEPAEGSTEKAKPAEPKPTKELTPYERAVKDIKAGYVAAKRRYRVSPSRIEKLQEALSLYEGTHNFHNYTILKTFNDPSAKRHIKSFIVNPKPIQIRDTEWLSIKVHGQSFMMHQIRKMIAMAVMVTRCGATNDLITESYGPRRISIPKAPGLGLLLERPVFEEYNKKAKLEFNRDPIDFGNYEEKIQEFKDREIYRRMFEAEENDNAFHIFFHQLDNFKTDYFLWVTADGLEAAYERTDRGLGEKPIPKALEAELGDEADGVEEVAN